MRLDRTAPVAGIDPELARTIAKLCRSDWRFPEFVAERIDRELSETVEMLKQLEGEGFLKRGQERWDGELEDVWTTTLRGGALAQASFLKPITRAKAESLLAGVLERAATYNADEAKPMWIEKIVLFGSLLDDEAVDFGDVDLQLTSSTRESDEPNIKLTYAQNSGRQFSSFMDELFWAETELRQILKKRSPYISITNEDISLFTDRSKVVFEREAPRVTT